MSQILKFPDGLSQRMPNDGSPKEASAETVTKTPSPHVPVMTGDQWNEFIRLLTPDEQQAGCFRLGHRFTDAAPGLLEFPKLRMSAGQVRQTEWYAKCSSRFPIGSNPGDQHFNRVRSLSGQRQCAALVHHSECLPIQRALFFGQSDNLLGLRGCRGAQRLQAGL
ncbi:MAG TPA: hypothetical protein VNX23_10550 [Bradyrhizobium sp.]|uniref:hypothetical protein n=1 Tax=Bradyrhizobium sp. TaxID=376 RepID=UPI002C3B3852|nr:hypothetical protein [Bradyrhizobium sp.]HXB77828.1 hypothetical protein [Bradyrhizobium sp.]